MRNILEVVRLVRVLESDLPNEEKVAQLKMVRDNGDITQDEAVELVLEYWDGKNFVGHRG